MPIRSRTTHKPRLTYTQLQRLFVGVSDTEAPAHTLSATQMPLKLHLFHTIHRTYNESVFFSSLSNTNVPLYIISHNNRYTTLAPMYSQREHMHRFVVGRMKTTILRAAYNVTISTTNFVERRQQKQIEKKMFMELTVTLTVSHFVHSKQRFAFLCLF